MRPLIAIDICNTLADVDRMLQEALGPRPDASIYRITGATETFFKENHWVFTKAPVIAGAVEGVKLLAAAGDIVYLTARPEWAKGITLEWLMRNGFPKARVIHSTKKATAAGQMNVSLAVEDAPHEIDALKGICPVLVHARTYNEGYPGRFKWGKENIITATIDLLTMPSRRKLKVIS